MSNPIYLEASHIQSVELTVGSQAHRIVIEHLGLPLDATIKDIQIAFATDDWHFRFEGNRIVGLEPNDDQVIPHPDNIKPLALIFYPNSFIEWEESNERVRLLLLGDSYIQADEISEHMFPAEVYIPDQKTDHIAFLKERLEAFTR